MDEEVDALGVGDTDLNKTRRLAGTDQHRQVIEVEHPDRIAVGVRHVLVWDPVPPRARQDDGIHGHKVP